MPGLEGIMAKIAELDKNERYYHRIMHDEQRGVNNNLTCIFSTTTPKDVVMEKM